MRAKGFISTDRAILCGAVGTNGMLSPLKIPTAAETDWSLPEAEWIIVNSSRV